MKLLLSYPLPSACSTETIYHDPREQVTVVHKMTEGVSQGGAMSSALFNMGQSVAIRPAAAAHPQVHILLIADDIHVLGPSEAVIAAILDIRERYAASPVGSPQSISTSVSTELLQSSPALKDSLMPLPDHQRLASNLCMHLSASVPHN